MTATKYQEGTDPLLVIMNQYSFNKMKRKCLFLKNCSLLIEGVDLKELESFDFSSQVGLWPTLFGSF